MLSTKEQRLLDLLEPQAVQKGIEIVTLEVTGSKKSPTIRVYIDAPDGVSFDVLASSQAWIGDVMDAVDPFPGAYMLEVSSPGIDRPLRTREHFARFAGEQVRIMLTEPLEGRSSWTGLLKGMEGDSVLLEADDQTVALPFDGIKRAHVKGTIAFG